MTTTTKPIHPGEVLLEVYMKPAIPPFTVEMLSKMLHVPEQSLADFIKGRQAVTSLLALQLSVICRTTPDYWLKLQYTYDAQTHRKRGSREDGRKPARINPQNVTAP